MRHKIAKIGSILLASMILLASVSTAFAAAELKINDATVNVNEGDTIKFTLNLSDTTEDIIGFELRVFFDSEKLELVKGSVTSDKFDNLFYNEDLDGKLPMNWTDFNNPVNCSKKTPFFSCNFKVLSGGEAKISYFVTELYGDDLTSLKSYTWSYDITDGDTPVVTDGVLPITDDKETLDNRQSQFINYVDGKGELNTPNKDNHESVVGVMPTTRVDTEIIEVTRYEDVENGGSSNSGSNGSSMIFFLIAIPVIGGLIALAIVLAVRKSKKSADEAEGYIEEPKLDVSAEQEAMEESGESDEE